MLRRVLDHFRRRRWEARGLFCFPCDGRLRAVDPYCLWRALANHKNLDLARDAAFIDAGAEPQTTNYLTILCELLGVGRWDPAAGRGMTDAELYVLGLRFQDYLNGLKKNGAPGPISSPASASASSTSPAAQDATASPSSDSGSIAGTSSASTPCEPSAA